MNAIERNARNLRASLSFYGPAREEGGVVLITSNVTYSVFNIALLDGPVSPAPGELERRIRLARDHFNASGRAWSFWVCEDWLPQKVQRKLNDVFDGFDMRCIAESPGLEIGEMAPPRRELPSLVYRPVMNDPERTVFTELIAQCFFVPLPVAREVYQKADLWDGPLRAWLAYSNGQAVSAAATSCTAGSLGVYSVATHPSWRRRGCAEAVMRHAIAEARRTCPEWPIVLQSSSFGIRLYRELGFKRVTRFFVYATA